MSLIGIDSVECSSLKRYGSRRAARSQIWAKLGTQWKPANLATMSDSIRLEQLQGKIEVILKGGMVGRTMIDLT
ncbi:MAG: hypothetical protein WBA13_02525 [Microcoleaceae cyanobacterium]